MKKVYAAPSVEVVKFEYRDQVVAASACSIQVVNVGSNESQTCTSGWQEQFKHN